MLELRRASEDREEDVANGDLAGLIPGHSLGGEELEPAKGRRESSCDWGEGDEVGREGEGEEGRGVGRSGAAEVPDGGPETVVVRGWGTAPLVVPVLDGGTDEGEAGDAFVTSSFDGEDEVDGGAAGIREGEGGQVGGGLHDLLEEVGAVFTEHVSVDVEVAKGG